MFVLLLAVVDGFWRGECEIRNVEEELEVGVVNGKLKNINEKKFIFYLLKKE